VAHECKPPERILAGGEHLVRVADEPLGYWTFRKTPAVSPRGRNKLLLFLRTLIFRRNFRLVFGASRLIGCSHGYSLPVFEQTA